MSTALALYFWSGCQDLVSWVLKFQNQPLVLFDSAIFPVELKIESKIELEQINLSGVDMHIRESNEKPLLTNI